MAVSVQVTKHINDTGYCAIHHFWCAYGKCQDSFYSDRCDFLIDHPSLAERCSRFVGHPHHLSEIDAADWSAGVGHQYRQYILPCEKCYEKYHTKVEDERIKDFFASAWE